MRFGTSFAAIWRNEVPTHLSANLLQTPLWYEVAVVLEDGRLYRLKSGNGVFHGSEGLSH